MKRRSLRTFERRVGSFLLLVVAYLLSLQGLHWVGLVQAHRRLAEEAALRAELAAESVLLETGPERLLRTLDAWHGRGIQPRGIGVSRRFLRDRGVTSVELLTPEGWGLETAVRTQTSGDEDRRPRLERDALRRLAAGRPEVDVESGTSAPPPYAVVLAWQPVLDASGRLRGILEVSVAAERLAHSRRALRWGLAVQGGSLAVFLVLLAAFIHWTLRPLRLLQATASDETGETDVGELESKDDTGFVIETYRRMVDDLRDKEQELRRLRELERHRANELQDLNASIVDSMVSGVLLLDLSGRVRIANETARQIFAMGKGRVVGRPFEDVLPHLPELHGRLRDCLDEGRIVRRDELRLNLSGVGRRDVGLTVSPLRDRDGQRTGALCLVVDLTEVKLLQEQVRLKESLAELGELSGGIAHEFRNSLATILGYAKLVERQGEGEVIEHAAEIREEVGALRTVVDDFLRFANPTRLVVESIDLAALLSEIAEDGRARLEDGDVEIEVPSELPTIAGDETLLSRVFSNLVRNAVDAAGPGGRVRIEVEVSGREIALHVDDDGPGVPAGERDKVFVPFFTRKERGTGLGLPLVRKVVLHHGGRVEVCDSPLGGARFTVRLPRKPPAETEEPAREERERRG